MDKDTEVEQEGLNLILANNYLSLMERLQFHTFMQSTLEEEAVLHFGTEI